METRANYALIGSIVLALILALFGFIIWITKIDINTEFSEYDILFEKSVAGLSEGAPVRYKGISVGQVRKLDIDTIDPSRIRATIRVRSDTPIFTDTIASLDSQGFTGLAFILLDTGVGSNKPLRKKRGEERPVIQVKPSQLQEIFTSVPELMAEATVTIARFQKLLGDENIASIANILKSTDRLTANLADKGPTLQASIDNFNTMAIEVRAAADDYRKLAASLDGAVTADLKPTLAQLRKTTASLEHMSNDLEAMVSDSRAPINNFTNNTLPEAGEFIVEARRLAASLSRIAERLERDPGEFLSQGQQPEYDAK